MPAWLWFIIFAAAAVVAYSVATRLGRGAPPSDQQTAPPEQIPPPKDDDPR